MLKLRHILFVFFLIGSSIVKADGIDKAFESLKIQNYFDAKRRFEKKLKKSTTSPAAFGLATIYYRQDNPFHQIDSAYNLIRLAESSYELLKEKKATRYGKFGFSVEGIKSLKEQISQYYFLHMNFENTVADWTRFIRRNPDYSDLTRAKYIRDSLAFVQTKAINTTQSIALFLNDYPDSEWKGEALDAFYLAQYREETFKGTVEEYQKFIEKFSENPYILEAQDQVYNIVTSLNTVEVLNTFIHENPKNRNVTEAWRRLYQVYMYDYSEERIEQFEKEFSDYPFKNELRSDIQLSRLILFPCKVFNKYGAMDLDGQIAIPPTYESMNLFSEGLALVSKGGKFGYINKLNELVIPCQFNSGYDFEQGRAVVEISDKYGLIDRAGTVILPVEFEDIGTFSEGLIYAAKDGKYGYYDKFGTERIKENFNEAFGFVNGLAKVQLGENQTYINSLGEFIFPPKYKELNFFTQNLVVFSEDDYFGLKTVKDQLVLPAKYDNISFLSNGLAMIIEEDEIGYIDSLGKIVIEPKFETYANCIGVGPFLNGFAVAKSNGKMGLIDKSGKFVVKNIYTQLGKNAELIAFNKGKLWGYMDPKGKVVLQPKYDWAESFENKLAIVAKEEHQGIISREGKEVLPIVYSEISRIGDDHFLIDKEGKLGLANKDGGLIVPIEYSEIRQLNRSTFVLVRENELDYLYLPNNRIVQHK